MIGKIACAEAYVQDVKTLAAAFDQTTVDRIRKEMLGYKDDLGRNDDEGIAIPGGIGCTKMELRLRVKTVLLKLTSIYPTIRQARSECAA